MPWKEQSKNLSLRIQVQEKQGDAASASSQCEDTLGKNANNTWQNRCFSLPYYFFINFWFLKIQGTFSTFMLCFVELWSHCYSHMYKYDTVFFLKNSLGDYYLFRTIRGRLYTMKHFFVKFWCKKVTIKDFSTTSFLKTVIDKLLTLSGCNNRYNGIWTSEINQMK